MPVPDPLVFSNLTHNDFNGVDSNVQGGHLAPLNMIDNQFTLSARIRPDSFGDWEGIITKGITTAPFAMQVWGDGSLRASLNWTAIGNVEYVFNSDTKMVAGNWYDVAITYDGSQLKFYINGVLDSNQPSPDLVLNTNTENLVIGADYPGGDEFFDGIIGNVKIFDVALDQVGIDSLRGPVFEDLTSRDYNGSSDTTQFPSSASLILHSTVTLAAHICPDAFGDWQGIITKGINTGPYSMQVWELVISRFASNWGTPVGSQGGGEWNSMTTMVAGNCYDIATTYDGTTVRFYIDGVLDGNQPVPSPSLIFGTAAENLTIGVDFPGGDEYFDGDIASARVYNRALSQAEIQALQVEVDSTSPISGAGTFATNQSQSSIDLNWTPANDETSSQTDLTYSVFYSTSTLGNSVTSVESGIPFGGSEANLTSVTVNQLNDSTVYYFNVVVADQQGNKSIYTEATLATDQPESSQGPVFEDLVSREYNGSSDVIQHPHTAAMITDSVTLAANICPDSFGNFEGIITKGVNSSTYAMQVWGNGALQFLTNGSNPANSINNGFWRSNATMTAGRCYDVAVTFDGTTVKFYIDGVLDSNQPVPSPTVVFGDNTENLTIGSDLEAGDEWFDGDIAKVKVYNRALSLIEIQELRVSQFQDLTSRNYNGVDEDFQHVHSNDLAINNRLTIAATICPDSFGDWEGIVTKGVNTSPYALQIWGDGSLRFASNWGAPAGAVGSGTWELE